jgi:hypothetical protein
METTSTLVKAVGLDPAAEYSLGNKDYFYKRECNSGHKDLKDEEIGFTGGYYDGYNWTVPVCKRCIATQGDKRIMVYSHYTPFHLKPVQTFPDHLVCPFCKGSPVEKIDGENHCSYCDKYW